MRDTAQGAVSLFVNVFWCNAALYVLGRLCLLQLLYASMLAATMVSVSSIAKTRRSSSAVCPGTCSAQRV